MAIRGLLRGIAELQTAGIPVVMIAGRDGRVTIRQDSAGRYCLNDLQRAAGGEKRHQPSD